MQPGAKAALRSIERQPQVCYGCAWCLLLLLLLYCCRSTLNDTRWFMLLLLQPTWQHWQQVARPNAAGRHHHTVQIHHAATTNISLLWRLGGLTWQPSQQLQVCCLCARCVLLLLLPLLCCYGPMHATHLLCHCGCNSPGSTRSRSPGRTLLVGTIIRSTPSRTLLLPPAAAAFAAAAAEGGASGSSTSLLSAGMSLARAFKSLAARTCKTHRHEHDFGEVRLNDFT
jgi:hypothetical protein